MDYGGAQERWKLRQDLIIHSLGRSPPDFLARVHSFGRRIFIQIKYPNLGLFMARSIEDTVLKGDKFMRFSNTERMAAHFHMCKIWHYPPSVRYRSLWLGMDRICCWIHPKR